MRPAACKTVHLQRTSHLSISSTYALPKDGLHCLSENLQAEQSLQSLYTPFIQAAQFVAFSTMQGSLYQ